nr:hypothetical protein [Tanacetum cinerariifolium]
MGRDTIQLENAVSTISQEYMLEFTSEYGIPKSLHLELPGLTDPIVEFPEGKVGVYTKFFEFANFRWMSFSKRPGKNTPQCYTNLLDSLKNRNNQFFWVDDRVSSTVVDWRTSALKDQIPSVGSYSVADVTILNTRRTPIQKQPEALLCLVGLSQRYFLRDDVYLTFLYDDDWDMDLFSLINAPNPAKVKIKTRPRAANKVPLLTVTTNRVINMEDMTGTSGSSGAPSTVKKLPLDFSNEDPPLLITERIRTEEQGQDELSQGIAPVGNPSYTEVTPKTDLKKGTVSMRALVNKRRRKRGPGEAKANAPPMVLRKDHVASHTSQSTLGRKSLASMGIRMGPTISVPTTQETPVYAKGVSSRKAVVTEDPDSEKSTSFTFMVGSPGSIYQPLGHPDCVITQLWRGKWQVAMGSQLRLRFEHETKLLKKAVAQVARRDQRIQAREKQIDNLEALLEAEADMKDIADAKNVKLAQVTGKEMIKAAFEEFKKYEDDRCVKKQAYWNSVLLRLFLDDLLALDSIVRFDLCDR